MTVILYLCGDCGNYKDWSEMHNEILCKNCWIKKENVFYHNRAKAAWTSRKKNK